MAAARTGPEEHELDELDAILLGLGLLGRGAVAAATQELEQDGLDATLLLLLGPLGRRVAILEPGAAVAAMQELEQDGLRAILLLELLELLALLGHLRLPPMLPVVLAIWTAREEVYGLASSHFEGISASHCHCCPSCGGAPGPPGMKVAGIFIRACLKLQKPPARHLLMLTKHRFHKLSCILHSRSSLPSMTGPSCRNCGCPP